MKKKKKKKKKRRRSVRYYICYGEAENFWSERSHDVLCRPSGKGRVEVTQSSEWKRLSSGKWAVGIYSEYAVREQS